MNAIIPARAAPTTPTATQVARWDLAFCCSCLDGALASFRFPMRAPSLDRGPGKKMSCQETPIFYMANGQGARISRWGQKPLDPRCGFDYRVARIGRGVLEVPPGMVVVHSQRIPRGFPGVFQFRFLRASAKTRREPCVCADGACGRLPSLSSGPG